MKTHICKTDFLYSFKTKMMKILSPLPTNPNKQTSNDNIGLKPNTFDESFLPR